MSLKPRLHQDTCCRIQVVSTCRRQHVSCIGDKIVASLSPVCCWIQRDTSRPWHKWIVIMSPRYPERATCIRRHVSIDIYVSGYKLLIRDTCFRATFCPGVNAALRKQQLLSGERRLQRFYYNTIQYSFIKRLTKRSESTVRYSTHFWWMVQLTASADAQGLRPTRSVQQLRSALHFIPP